MNPTRKRVARVFLATATALGVGVAGGVTLTAARGQDAPPSVSPPGAQQPNYPVNAKGESYGAASAAPRPDLEPDLILVVADDGQEGYVGKAALDGPHFTGPQQAVAWQAQHADTARVLPVFRVDGTTRI